MRLFYNHNMLSLWFSLQVINTYLHNIQLVLVHLPCKVTFIIFAMKQLNYSVLSSLPFSFSYFLFIWCHISFYQRKNYLLYMCVLVTQSCPTFCNHMACSPPGSSVHGILQARILEWVPCPSPGDLPDPGIKLGSPALQADSLLSEPPGKPLWRKVGN